MHRTGQVAHRPVHRGVGDGSIELATTAGQCERDMSPPDHEVLERLKGAVIECQQQPAFATINAKVTHLVTRTRCTANLELPPCGDTLALRANRDKQNGSDH